MLTLGRTNKLTLLSLNRIIATKKWRIYEK